jgi:S-adenosylmethionine hydrolase
MQAADRPFISFLTDFGPDAAAAICRGVMLGIARDAQIVDISHSIRKYAIRDGAYLLWISLSWLPVGVHVAVVDPGVGTARRPIGILTARGDVLIGPDNGLLTPAARVLGGAVEARVLENRAWMLPNISSTFHGRDIFSPMAAHVALGGAFESVGPRVDLSSVASIDFPEAVASDGQLETSIVYIASFGNLHLAGSAADLARAFGTAEPGARFAVEFVGDDGRPAHVEEAPYVRTFGETSVGTAMLYEDSFGRLGYADNQGDAARRLGARLDQRIRIRRP